MANYRDIKGFQVQSTSSDPVPYSGSWSSGAACNTARVFDATAQTGTNTTGQIAGGTYPGGGANTEQYNGTTWTEVSNLNTGRFDIFGVGTQTSAIAASGYTTTWVTNCESWNGASWTEVADVNQGRKEGGSAGISNTSALIFGGEGSPSSTQYALTEKWNGASWTEVGDLNAAIYGTSGAGTITSAIRAGGVTDGAANPSATVEIWNGASWTESTDINTARGYIGNAGANSTAALVISGTTNNGPTLTAKVESWDNTTWTEVADVATARYKVNGAGTATEALAIAGGSSTAGGTATEEWAFPPATSSLLIEGDMWFNTTTSVLKVYGAAAGVPNTSWASGATINTARGIGVGVGDTTAGLIWGGYRASPAAQLTVTESYNGTAWTEVSDLPTAVQYQARGGVGTQTAALSAGGEPTGNNQTESEVWDGSSWAENTEMNTPHVKAGAAGTQTAGLIITSFTPGNENVEVWNGSTWTEVANVNTKGGDGAGFGSSTAAIYTGGERPGTVAITESYDGTAWTEVADLNTARYGLAGSGGQPLGMVTGGYQSTGTPNSVLTESWNGSAWTEIGDLANARYGPLGSGGAQSVSSAVNAFVAGSYNPTNITNTEEFVASSAINTVTTS